MMGEGVIVDDELASARSVVSMVFAMTSSNLVAGVRWMCF
jgi:hypothetical protein